MISGFCGLSLSFSVCVCLYVCISFLKILFYLAHFVLLVFCVLSKEREKGVQLLQEDGKDLGGVG